MRKTRQGKALSKISDRCLSLFRKCLSPCYQVCARSKGSVRGSFLFNLIASMTKFSIMTCSKCTYIVFVRQSVCDHVDVQLEVANLKFLQLDTHVVRMSIVHLAFSAFISKS